MSVLENEVRSQYAEQNLRIQDRKSIRETEIILHR
jgi:hypothetical protein